MKNLCPSWIALLVSAVAVLSPGRAADDAARVYALDLSAEAPPVRRGHLDLGGEGPAGKIEVNSFYLAQNGRAFIPVVGEFHYCRYPAAEWEDALRKMQAGGITVVASYVFWNLHERSEGRFDWSGDLDLRRFVQTVRKVGLRMILRVGPFAHGEIRNGGLPDWLYGRAFEVRSNDPEYLRQVEKLYAAISAQVAGQFHQDGGPILGVQLENEFQHSAAPWDIRYAGAPIERTIAERDQRVTHAGVSVSTVKNENAGYGRDHLVNLKVIARRCGLVAPLYTATGWGNAAIVPLGSVPVTSAYPYPFWTPVAKPSPFYLFKDLQRNPDYLPVSYDATQYPSLAAELGAGMCLTYARRAFVPEASLAPLIVRVLGSGSNGIGYYMYHGGATPVFDQFYNEDASGLPKINYDYQAPIGQYGRVKDHYFSLRRLHLFLASYGERLAPLPVVLPETNAAIVATDTRTLRYAARAARGAGFVFLLNFQDHVETADLPGLRLALQDGRRTIPLPQRGTLTLKAGAAAILPVNLDLDGTVLRSATVQPLTILRRPEGARYVFFTPEGFEPELVFDAGRVTAAENCQVAMVDGATVITGPGGRSFSFSIDGKPVLVVPDRLALGAAETGDGRLLFAPATVTFADGRATVRSAGEATVDLAVYPAPSALPDVAGATVERAPADTPALAGYRLQFAPVDYTATWREVAPRRYAVRFDAGLGALHDVFMRVDYVGDTAQAFIDGRMVDDHFYSGRPWEIGLRRLLPQLAGRELVFVFHAMPRDASYLKDLPAAARPAFAADQRQFLRIDGLRFTPEYEAVLTLPE